MRAVAIGSEPGWQEIQGSSMTTCSLCMITSIRPANDPKRGHAADSSTFLTRESQLEQIGVYGPVVTKDQGELQTCWR